MSNCDAVNSLNLLSQAECEIAAFLKAITEVPGASDRRLVVEAWFESLESLSWPDNDLQKFFRTVSIRAISQIVAGSGANKRIATSRAIDGGRSK